MKIKYEVPEIEFLMRQSEEIIRTSVNNGLQIVPDDTLEDNAGYNDLFGN